MNMIFVCKLKLEIFRLIICFVKMCRLLLFKLCVIIEEINLVVLLSCIVF